MINIGRSIRDLMILVIDWFYKPFKSIIPQETFRYAATGGANTLLDIFLYFLCYNFVLDKENLDFGLFIIQPHVAAFLIVFPITFSTGFFLAKYITFVQSELRGKHQLVRYLLTVGGSILLNIFLLKFLVEYLFIWATVSKIIITVIVVIYSYMAQRYFTFKTGKPFFRKAV